MGSPLDPYQDLVHTLGAHYGRTIDMNIYRPLYNQAGTESLLYSNVPMRIDPSGGSSHAMPPMSGVSYFVIAGPKEVLKPGDILRPSVSDGATPAVTVISNVAMSNITGVRTSKVGNIIDTTRIAAAIYQNVAFDFISGPGLGDTTVAEFEGSKQFETHRAFVYYREGIVHGKRLIYKGRRYLILAVAETGNQMLLQLQGDNL